MNYYDIDDHVEAVMRWLEDHVLVFDTPHQLTVFDIHVDPLKYQGSFRLQLDDVVLDVTRVEDPFTFSLSQNGKPLWHSPMFYSPLGAPASYSAVTLSDDTEHAIQQLLERLLPTMRPLGLNRETGILLTYGVALEDRILDADEYDSSFAELSGARHTLKLKKANHD